MRIAILGAGAVGCYFGGRLAQAGEDVRWFARGATLEALRRRGLSVESLKGDFALPPQPATDRPHEIEAVDAVILGVKAWQVTEVAPMVASWLGPEGLVLPLQNGVRAVAELRAALGRAPVVGGVARIVCEVVSPGRVRHFGAEPAIELGPWGLDVPEEAELHARQRARCERLQRALAAAGVPTRFHDDARAASWAKFLFIASMSAVAAAEDQPVGVVRANPESRERLRRAMAEIEAVARAAGVALPPDVVARSLAFGDALPPASTTSMQRDIRAGRPSELDCLTGAVVRMGRELGVATPVHGELHARLVAVVSAGQVRQNPAFQR